MFDISSLADRYGGNAIENLVGGKLNGAATPLNSFISKVNSTLGTNFSQLNPAAMLKAAAAGNVASLFGGTQNKNSPVASTGAAFAKRNVANELDKRLDPITNFDWIAIVVNKNPGNNNELPWYYIDEITVPSPNFGSSPKFVEGKDKKYADMFSLNACTIKIYTDISGLAFNFCNDWVRSIYRDDNLYQMPIAYKKDIYVFILDTTRKVVVDIQLLGCWPTSWADYQLTSGSSSALESSLTLSVDDYKMKYDVNAAAVTASIERITAESAFWGNLSAQGGAGGSSTPGTPQVPSGLSAFQNAVKSAQDTVASVQNKFNSVLKF